jgi:predicted acylesterase/phospholipase RssA
MFRSLALGGGGARGGLLIGALSAIEKHRGHLVFPDGIYGSSVGSIVAIAVACGFSSATLQKVLHDPVLNMDKIIPPVRLSCLTSAPAKKGLFSMDLFEETLVALFEKHGYDLRSKTFNDLEQPVKVLASNMTTGEPTFLSGSVPLIDAMKCSCCLPFVFQPQILYNNVYLDGGVLVHHLHTMVPRDTLVIDITSRPRGIFPTDVETMSLASYIDILYQSARKQTLSPNVLTLTNTNLSVLGVLTNKDKERMFQEGYDQTLRFITQRSPQKLE